MSTRQQPKRQKGHTEFTPKRADRFLDVLSRTGNVTEAAAAINVSRITVYGWRERDKRFAKLWDEAREIACELLEQAAHNRAVEGWLEPVFHQGQIAGYKRKFSDTLLQTLLRANNPSKYRRTDPDELEIPTAQESTNVEIDFIDDGSSDGDT